MRKNFSILPVLSVIIGVLFAATAFSQRDVAAPTSLLLAEDFTYAAGSALTSNGWTAHSAGGTNAIVTSAPGLTLTGYPGSGVGNAVTLTTSGEDDNRTFATQTSGSVYAAFLVTVTDAAVDPIGGYFFHLGPDPVGTTFRARVFIKKDASNNIAFGISKVAGSGTELTKTGTVMGTPDYMAPEQARGDAGVDHRADVFALGAMLAGIAAGSAPVVAIARKAQSPAPG